MSEKFSIESDAISFTPGEDGKFCLTMRSAMGRVVTVSKEGQGQDPVVNGDPELAESPAIVKRPLAGCCCSAGIQRFGTPKGEGDSRHRSRGGTR